jgi:hypothetical protein
MDPVQAKLLELEKKIDAIYVSVEKTRKYFLWTGIITLAVIVLPLLFLPFALSQMLTYLGGVSDLGNLGI